jgi:tryptophanyl-tRNA synthetase
MTFAAMTAKRTLTGIKPTGRPHLGNYLGAIKPALDSVAQGGEQIFFVANLHALTTMRDANEVRQLTHDVAATWLALGLDPEKVVFFRQSDVLEIPFLSWILSCHTAQGLLERAHAYKAAKDRDEAINAGLYTYPVLMAADILSFRSTHVPVGEDQKQHVEYARDIAMALNHHHGEVLTIPQAVILEQVATIPGTDGRKMSKSYDNTVPIFAPPDKLKKAVFSIKTDSAPVEAPKDPDKSSLFQIYKNVATPTQTAAFEKRYREGGMGWGEAKQTLLTLLLEVFEPKRARYDHLMAHPEEIEAVFAAGARKAHEMAGATIADVRKAVGV